jgi:hypothetical protein
LAGPCASEDAFQSPDKHCSPDSSEEAAIVAEQGCQFSEQGTESHASHAVSEVDDLMPRIAGKQFIGALPVQHDFRATLGSQFEGEVLARYRYTGNGFLLRSAYPLHTGLEPGGSQFDGVAVKAGGRDNLVDVGGLVKSAVTPVQDH